MKRKFKRASKSMLSVILAILIVMSTMLIGTLSVNAAENGKFTAGEKIYFDFSQNSATQANTLTGTYAQNEWNETLPESKIVTVVLKKEIDFTTYDGRLYKIPGDPELKEVNNDNSKGPSNGQNMVIVDAYGNYTWGTYGGDEPGPGPDPGPTPTAKYYLFYWDGSNNIPVKMEAKVDESNKVSYIITTNSTYLNNDRKFKITNSDASGAQDNVDHCVNKNINNDNVYRSPSLITAGVAVTWLDSEWNDIQITNTEEFTFIIEYTPDETDGLHGNVKVWTVEDYNNQGDTNLTDGAISLKDGTAVNGYLSFSAPQKNPGTADVGDVVTITANPFAGFTCSGIAVSYTNPEGTAVNESLTVDNNNTCTFPVPDVQATLEGKKSISFAASFTLDKKAYLDSKGDGLWIDVAPDKEDTTATLIKWNNYYGNNHATSNPYTFYVPKKVDLSNAKIYNGFGSDVIVNGKKIASKSFNADTDKISLSVSDNIAVTGIDGVTSIKVMQGSTASMFLYTTDGGTTEYDLPTYKDDLRVQLGKYEDKYTKEYEYKKGAITAKGGTCTTITKDDKISTAMPLDQVKGRGNSSWKASATLFGKYAFNMKLSSKTNLYGLDAAKSWCLLANNMDQSMLRNAFTYDLAKAVGLPNSPEFEFVDIYDNGEYMGAYLVTEKVDVGKSKLVKGESIDDIHDAVAEKLGEKVNESQVVDVDSQKSFTVTGEPVGYNQVEYNCAAVSTDNAQQYTSAALDGTTIGSKTYAAGTFLLEFEISKRVRNEVSWFKTPRGQYVVVKSPEFATEEEVKYIATKFVQMENKIYANVDVPTLSRYMDVDSFARMYLIQEISSNLDSAATSYYLTYCCADQDARFVASPVWDYDWAFGQHSGDGKKGIKVDIANGVQGDYVDLTSDPLQWFARYKGIGDNEVKLWNIQSQLANNPAFQTVIKKVWNGTGVDGFKGIVNDYCKAEGQLDTWKGEINNSIAMNEARWGFISDMKTNTNKYWGSVDTTGNTGRFDGAVNYLKDTWTNTRVQDLLDVEINKFGDYYQMASPTLTVTAADGTALPAEVPVNTQLKFKADTSEIFVTYELYRNGVQVGTSNTTGEFDVTADEVGIFEYNVRTVYGTGEGSIKESQPVTVKVTGVELPELTGVVLEANKTKVTPGTTVTLTATPDPVDVTDCTYTFYSSADGRIDDNDTQISSSSNTASVKLDTAGTYYYYVKATSNGITVPSSVVQVVCEEQVTVLAGLVLEASAFDVTAGTTVTLTAKTDPSDVKGYTYTFYRSTDNVIGNDDDTKVVNSSKPDIKVITTAPKTAGKYYYYVKATCAGKDDVTSRMICVTATAQQAAHIVKVWFKSASASAYVPSVSLDNGDFTTMTRIKKSETNSTYFGSTYSGSLKFYWYSAEIEIDSTYTHTLTFKTAGTSVNATSRPDKFNSSEYYFAVDNLMDDDTLVTLPSGDDYEYIRNYHRSATHMVYSELVDGSSSLGFTYIDGQEYPMGMKLPGNDNSQNDIQSVALNSRLVKIDVPSAASLGAGNAAFTIESATLTQKFVADIIDVSELQRCLLDVNLDEQVDIRDVTLMQKALAQ